MEQQNDRSSPPARLAPDTAEGHPFLRSVSSLLRSLSNRSTRSPDRTITHGPQKALNSFFEANMEEVFGIEDLPGKDNVGPAVKNKRKTSAPTSPGGCIDLTTDEPACSSAGKTPVQNPPEDEKKLSLISWNVDGLDTDNLGERARSLCSYIVLYSPDVVFLQELIPSYVLYLKKQAVSYTLIEGGEESYFTGMMLKKSRIVPYTTTKMMRNLLIAQVTFQGQELSLMTSHLESCKDNSAERMKQLRLITQKIKEAPDNVTVLFGGDTNLRDAEVAKVGLPSGVMDVWEKLGRQEHCRYTWDTKTNSNKRLPFACRCRFDRVYLRPAKREGVACLLPNHMALLGLEKLDCGRYTSDHWGVYCSFSAG
ncbi:hypothetical protein NHX12_010160 [Muraenolepis orangiensis]|uniref:Tyrosyl-DNA phosphodiesterase 2 n=1 Tax=Muraenolepis orangiensis TaxID=630683 RepID=A0A9Q0I8M3_9TELE|nr:hypothetical protein NHX12_010160 [Muraenolepis orangiensis]